MSGEVYRLRTVAPAKVNWTLEVLGRRDDGYHEVRSVMQTISLADELSVRPAPAFSLTVDGERAADLRGDENLVARAARAFPEQLASRPVALALTKRIPAAAGLGGGSSDAAAALRLLRSLWSLHDAGEIARVAASLGSDVPFFLRGGAQCAAGKGERLTPLPTGLPVHLVLLTPPLTVANKTARLFAQLRLHHHSDGSATERLAARLRDGGRPSESDYVNVFDAVAGEVFAGVGEYRRLLERVAGARALLAGAGPSLFALCPDEGRAESARDALVQQGLRAWSVQSTAAGTATEVL